MKDCIDVSKWQGTINWALVAAAYRRGEIGGVILRAGYGYATRDPCFEANYAAASAAGIPCGAYWYAYWGAGTPTQECKAFLQTIGDRELKLGIWYDVEYEKTITSLDKATRTSKVLEGLAVLAASGRYCGLYASTDMINNRLEFGRLRGYDIWVAQYSSKCTCKLPYGLWQYTSKGRAAGITGNVDRDHVYKDYPSIVVGRLAGGTAAADKPVEVPSQDAEPRKTWTVEVGPMTAGDLRTVLELAGDLGLYVTGTLTIGPMTAGDRKSMETVAGSLAVDCKETG